MLVKVQKQQEYGMPVSGGDGAGTVIPSGRSFLLDRPMLPNSDTDGTGEEVEEFYEVVLRTGELCYIAGVKESLDSRGNGNESNQTSNNFSANLLPVPIYELQAQLARQERLRVEAAAAAEDGGDDIPMEKEEIGDGLTAQPDANCASSALWVDKYAPQNFSDLLSPEQINRNVLKWIKLWDSRVFGQKDSPAGSKRPHKAISGYFGGDPAAASKRAKATDGYPKKTEEANHQFRFGPGWRPDSRVLLFAGPPGMGKTTLVCVARCMHVRECAPQMSCHISLPAGSYCCEASGVSSRGDQCE